MEANFNIQNIPLLTKKSDEEKKLDVEHSKTKRSITTIMYRSLKLNLDIFQLVIISITFLFSGYLLGSYCNGTNYTSATIIDFMGTLGAGIGIFIWRLYTPQGAICNELNKIGNNIDTDGKTIVT